MRSNESAALKVATNYCHRFWCHIIGSPLFLSSRRQEVANVLSASAPVTCPQCQSQLVVELEANPDGVEAKAAVLSSPSVSVDQSEINVAVSSSQTHAMQIKNHSYFRIFK